MVMLTIVITLDTNDAVDETVTRGILQKRRGIYYLKKDILYPFYVIFSCTPPSKSTFLDLSVVVLEHVPLVKNTANKGLFDFVSS